MSERKVELKNRDELVEFIKIHKYVIVKVGASWCGPCKRIQPYVDQLFSKMPKDVYLVIVDADEGDIAAALRVKTLPTFMNFINGDLQDVYSSGNKDEVLKFFNSTLSWRNNH
tara:strand:+ start:1077 stop:1415 length:339 start_codon:yes stop_codon:yes gene_type:complete